MKTAAILLLLVVLCTTMPGSDMAQSSNPVNPGKSRRVFDGTSRVLKDRQYRAGLRTIGLAMDTAQIPLLIQCVRETADEGHFATALHSMAQIGGAEAMQATEDLLQDIPSDEPVYRYTQAAYARLLAQTTVQKLTDASPQQRSHVFINSFLRALNHDVTSFHAAVAQQQKQAERSTHPQIGRDVYALRQLADVIYRNRDATLLAEARQMGIDFDQDAGSRYKAQLALLSSRQRVQWILDYLCKKPAITFEDEFLIQLAADEGKIASRAAAAKLNEMDENRDLYVDRQADSKGQIHRLFPGMVVMFDVIAAAGDKEQEPLMAHYVNHPESYIRHYAKQAYDDIRMGIPMQRRPGY